LAPLLESQRVVLQRQLPMRFAMAPTLAPIAAEQAKPTHHLVARVDCHSAQPVGHRQQID